MNHHEPQFAARLAALSRSYRASLPARLGAIETPWAEITRGAGGLEEWTAVYRAAHNLAGSAATFDVAALSECAQRLEELVESAMASRSPRVDHLTDIDAALEALRAAVHAASAR